MDFLYMLWIGLLVGCMVGGTIALLVWLPLPVAIFFALVLVARRAR